MDDIALTLKNMSPLQMVLVWTFVSCYALALGGMLGTVGSLRAGLGALLAGVLFAALSDNWVHGSLLMLFAVAGMGVFVALSWALTYGTALMIQRRSHIQVPIVRERRSRPRVQSTEPMRVLRDMWRSFVTS